MSGRWYSITIHSTQLESLRTALEFARMNARSPLVGEEALAASEAMLRQIMRHIHNEKTINDWERDFDE